MRDSQTGFSRRRYLYALGTAVTVSLAGCTGDDGSNGDDESTPTDDGGDATDDTPDQTATATATDDGGDDVTPTAPSSLAFEMESSFELDGEAMTSESEGHVDEAGNWYMFEIAEFEDGTVFEEESVFVDGTLYSVDDFGDCETFDSGPIDTSPAVEPEETTELLETATSLGQTTFEGTDVVEYEFDPEEAKERFNEDDPDSIDEFSGRIYVDVDTGYTVGGEFTVVTEDSTLESRYHHHSFGEDFDVSVPEEC